MNDKLYGVFGLIAGFLIAFIILGKAPDVETKKEVRTVESKYWKSEFTKLETKYNQYVQKNVEIEKTVTKLYDENGKLKSEVTDYKKKDLSKIDTAKTSTSATTITVVGEVKEIEKTSTKTINYTGSVFIMFDNLTYIPCTVGATYLVFSPIQVIGQYDIPQTKIKVGIMLQF